jgi:hypothetical protein
MKGFTGSGSNEGPLVDDLLIGRWACGRVGAGFEVRYKNAAGSIKRILKSHGVDEYIVVAKRVAQQFMRKSTKTAKGLYGVNVRLRDWRTDQRKIASCQVLC